jgi:hypothetical protein
VPLQSLQEQQQLLEFPADPTPTNLGGVRLAVSSADGGPTSVQQRDQRAASAALPDFTNITAQTSVASALPAGSSSGMHGGGIAVQQWQDTPQQQQQQGPVEVTPVKGSSTKPSAPGDLTPADMLSPPSALKRAAAALLASISPAGLVTSATPDAAAGRSPAASAAAAAASSLAGVLSPQLLSPQLLQHLTPEWLRSLKRKCKQESEQLQQLRRQMGLATPEAVLAAQQQQQLQGSISKGVPTPAAAASPAAPAQDGTPAAPGGRVSQAPRATPAGTGANGCAGSNSSTPAACSSANTGGNSASTPLAPCAPADTAVAGTSSNSTTPLALLAPAEAVSAGASAGHAGTGSRAAPTASHTGASSLGQLSSRSSIDRLRRRAIMAQATAAVAGDIVCCDTAAGGTGTDPAAPAGVHDLAAAAAAATVAAWVAADAASHDEQLDRSSSAGSLADYMRQNSWQREDFSVPVSRTGSITPNMLLTRPECPTPGSMYSDMAGNDTQAGADADPLSQRGSVSPDMLLVGLRNSRLAARQLQHQLLQQLEKTNSMPSVLPRQHEAALGAVLASGGLPRTTSAAAAEAAGAARAPAATVMEYSDDVDCCDSPALQASTRLVAVADEEAPSPAGGTVEQYGSPAVQLPGSSAGTSGAAVQHRQLARLLDEQPAAGSPATPGAALNAGSESRLLSPGVELQLVFDSSEADSAASASISDAPVAATGAFEVQSSLVGHQRGDSISGSSSRSSGHNSLRKQGQEAAAVLLASAVSPEPSESSCCMLPLGLAAKAQPEAEAALAAPSPPASVLSMTPGAQSRWNETFGKSPTFTNKFELSHDWWFTHTSSSTRAGFSPPV